MICSSFSIFKDFVRIRLILNSVTSSHKKEQKLKSKTSRYIKEVTNLDKFLILNRENDIKFNINTVKLSCSLRAIRVSLRNLLKEGQKDSSNTFKCCSPCIYFTINITSCGLKRQSCIWRLMRTKDLRQRIFFSSGLSTKSFRNVNTFSFFLICLCVW